MPTATAHIVGTFNWPELASTDPVAAKTFYRALFGWEIHDQPMGPDATYTIFKVRGLDVAALYRLEPKMQQAGVPPHWGTYITVDDADAAAEKARALGGSAIAVRPPSATRTWVCKRLVSMA